MAARTAYVRVNALQLKQSAGVMVEQGGLPLVRVVTTGAPDHSSVLDELGRMRIGVAPLAIVWCGPEVNVGHPDLQVRRFMALGTRHRPMCTQQSELCRRMIKLPEVLPGRNSMASLAAEGFSRAV